MNTEDEKIINAAINWWVDAVSNPQIQDAGDDSPVMTLSMRMLEAMYKPVDNSQKEIFRQALKESIIKPYMINYLSVDYGPSVLLSEAAIKAGIPRLNFPIKTNMQLRGYGKLVVSRGYGAPYEEITIED